jgi:nucleoside 2-deoxyribosyltransferase
VKFYIASRLENAETVKRVAAVLKAAGHIQTYDWTEHGSVQNEGQERITQVAESEKRSVCDADMVIVILPGGRDTHTELGIALGKGCGLILICAENDEALQQDERTCAFYWNYAVTRVVGQMDDWLKEILSRTRAIDKPYFKG